MYLTQPDWINVDLVWLLEIEYTGRTFRFSSIAISLEDSDGKGFAYFGGLEDVAIESRISRLGDINVESDSVALSITFPNRNLSIDYMNGKTLEGAKAKIGYTLLKDGQDLLGFDGRQFVFSGIVTDPIFGYPDAPFGYVEFSIESPIKISESSLLRNLVGQNMRVESISITPNPAYDITTPFPSSDGIVQIEDKHRGKIIPFVFGEVPSILTQSASSTGYGYTPAYVLAYDSGLAHKPVYYVIASHEVHAENVKVFDSEGNSDTIPVEKTINVDGRAYSYIGIPNSSTIIRMPSKINQNEWWIQWDDGGGYPNPYGSGSLEGGGDLCTFLLQQSTDDIDIDSWQALRSILNEYKFAGYINDDEITPFAWLQRNIVSNLPIYVLNGPRGLRCVFDMFLDDRDLSPRLTITANPSFFRSGPMIPLGNSENIINDVIVRYARVGVTDTYGAYVTVANRYPIFPNLLSSTNALCEISQQKYGIRRRTIELDYVYDWRTATKIANNIIRTNALPIKTIQYSLAPNFGWLELGDIISLTDPDIGLKNTKVQLLSKIFSEGRWLVDLKINNNPMNNERPFDD